jgi:hypothetical protein
MLLKAKYIAPHQNYAGSHPTKLPKRDFYIMLLMKSRYVATKVKFQISSKEEL